MPLAATTTTTTNFSHQHHPVNDHHHPENARFNHHLSTTTTTTTTTPSLTTTSYAHLIDHESYYPYSTNNNRNQNSNQNHNNDNFIHTLRNLRTRQSSKRKTTTTHSPSITDHTEKTHNENFENHNEKNHKNHNEKTTTTTTTTYDYSTPTILAHGIDELSATSTATAHFSHRQHMIAGAVAGTVEHSFMFPVDTIKTRMQSNVVHTENNVKMSTVLRQIRSEGGGPLRLYSGLSAVLAGAIPSHALYFATYEMSKNMLHHGKVPLVPDPMITGVSAILATMVHDAISTPLDVVKQRMQLNGQYRDFVSCLKHVTRTEGINALFLSYPTTLIMNIPYALVHFIGYETFKYLLHDHDEHDDHDHDHDHEHDHHHDEEEEEKERREHMWKHFVAGGGAGALGAAVSNPVDVMKTRLQTAGPSEYTGARDVLIRTLREEGIRGFMRGSVPRMLYHTPSAAITWTTYEYMKRVFKESSSSSSSSK